MARAVTDWQRRSAKTLTKLLATCPRHALHREQILDILWPGADLESAVNSFGKAVHAARHVFEPELPRRTNSTYLRLTDAMLALDAEHVVIDADQFERLAEDSLRREDTAAYESALAAYGGVLLPEDRYADWCAERRGYLSELHIRVLMGLGERLEARGAYNDSADRLREALREDQTREDIHRRLMLLYAEMGTSDQAVRQFHLCEDVLRRELSLAPQPETVCLYQDVLAGRAPHRKPTLGRGSGPVSIHRPPAAEAHPGRAFIGRERVLQRLCQLTRDHAAAAGLILISGEAGVGKTRLLEELAARASRQGATVLWGGSGAHAHHFLRGPFAVALEGYAASRPEAERNELALCYPSLARFVPSLGTKRQLPAQVCDSSDYQLDLIPDIVRLLTDLARKQPVLFIVGDLGEADLVSLDLVRYLAQLAVQRPWLMVGAVRKEDVDAGTEVWRMMDAAVRERLCLEIELRCLSRRDCDHLVRAMLAGSDVGDELTEQIYLWSGGNPLFIGALIQELRDCRERGGAPGQRCCTLELSGVTAGVPTRVRALTATRLACMDQTLRRVLELAAVALPAEASVRELRTWAAALKPPVSDAALGEALDRALLTGILEERPGGYAFRHPLVRSALCESLARHRLEELRRALAAPRGEAVIASTLCRGVLAGRRPEERWNPGASCWPGTVRALRARRHRLRGGQAMGRRLFDGIALDPQPIQAARLTGAERPGLLGPVAALPLGEHWATWGAARDGARVVMTRVQACALALPAVLGGILIGMNPHYWLRVCLASITGLYLVAGAHKIWLLARGEAAASAASTAPPLPMADDLPVYTVLVPLFREGRILPALIERLERLDYPPERLEVLLLIEPDDAETQRAASGFPFPSHIRPMLMPEGQPRTKPRALNIGLHAARGEYIVVYDAEDQPEPDQLRKAVAAMRALPTDVVCLQARLNFYNRHQSSLTRLGAVDYAVWYDQFLPGLTAGLTRPGTFVPLGGTSNHFRVEVLRHVGGWDPYNVTEDCDLGVRLGRQDLRVAMLDSATWEEAVPHASPWVRQRSRWVKGYIQTYLVHMRRPLRLCRELGPRGFVDFQMLVGASSLLLLVNPLMWTLTATYAASKGTAAGYFIQALFPAPVYYLALLSMTVWNFIFFYTNVYTCVRHDLVDLTRYTLLTPLYWVLMSLGAWSGLISLIRNPSYWAKTQHGFSLSEPQAATATAVGSHVD